MPQEVLSAFLHRGTYVAHGEAMAPLLAVFHHPWMFANADVLAFIDNLGICSALCGMAHNPDIGTILQVLHLWLADLDASLWPRRSIVSHL